MNFGACRLQRKLTPHGEETSIDVVVNLGSQAVPVRRTTATADLNFERFVHYDEVPA